MDSEFLSLLRDRLGSAAVLTGDDVTIRSADPFRVVPVGADAILRPRSTEEVALILREATARNIGVVPQGGRTGVSGGVDSLAGEIAISLERMNRIENVCPINRTIVVEAGVTIQQLQEAAAGADLFYPVDLGARGTATVGGTIATNAGGNRTLRWGMTRDRVLGLEAVLADGNVVSSMHGLIKNNTGYDLKHLFIGSEGTLGIVTRAVLRVVPAPTSHEVAFLSLADYASVLAVLNRAQRHGTLSAFEVMYANYYRIVTAANPAARPVADTSPFYVLIEAMGYDAESDREQFENLLAGFNEDRLVDDIVLAQSHQQRSALWSVRESVEIAVRALAPLFTFDVSLAVTDIDTYVSELQTTLEARFPDTRMIVNGHIGDNNIHLGITVGPDTPHHEYAIDDIVYSTLRPFGGAMSAEHGIGTTKNAWLGVTRSKAEIALMRRLKQAIDPHALLNRRVLFETEG